MKLPDHNEAPRQIQLLTLNCWGLKYIATYRRERLSEIGRRIANAASPPEIVGLQECWTQEDYGAIRDHTKAILPYGKFYYSGIFGGGLAILSKWPIEESSMFEYPLNGRPTAFFRGDWFVGKGVASARIRFGPGLYDVAEVFCTHLHAPYEREPNDSYLCHRTAQAWEISKLMRGAAERGHLVIGLGDFNMVPLSFAHRLITAHAPVQDVWLTLHPDSSIGAAVDAVEMERERPVPTAEFNVQENGATCDSVLNTWRWSKDQQKRLSKGHDIVIEGRTPDPKAKRLDYIFVGDGSMQHASDTPQWVIQSAKLSMTERHPTLKCSLSDHFAVEATIFRHVKSGPHTPLLGTVEFDKEVTPVSPSSTTHGIVPPSSIPSLSPETYEQILGMISTYTLRERFQRRARLSHFLLSILVTVGCLVAVWWSPRNFVAFILLLVSTLSFAAGVLDGLIGGLFMTSELRALKEFEWEVKNAKTLAERKVQHGVSGSG